MHTSLDAPALAAEQRAYFATGATRPYRFRVEQLRRLRAMLQAHEDAILEALRQDLGKPTLEAYASEIGLLYAELTHAIAQLKRWMRPRRVATPLALFPARSAIHYEPLGRILIIAPWNYPLQLLISPLIGAIAAGNCAVLKPSELAPHTAALVARMVRATFAPHYIAVVEGEADAAQALIDAGADHLFFTGGTATGKMVAKAAAERLIPTTLEMGGKSPCIIFPDADLDLAARRIVWGKFFNAGQTCVAPDYLLVHRSVKADLVASLIRYVHRFYGENPATSADYGRIINERHLDRLLALLDGAKVLVGGQYERGARYIAPTIIEGVSLAHPSMQSEIFGPILPVLTFDNLDEALATIRSLPAPLALYLFGRDEPTIERVCGSIRFGGGCINETVVHYGNAHLPFGGIGESGIGACRGVHSFELFSHKKSLLRGASWLDLPIRYPAYGALKLKLLRLFLR